MSISLNMDTNAILTKSPSISTVLVTGACFDLTNHPTAPPI